ncbi:MAG: GNAT family N-acetyltransferase [Acidobacteriaceae bacterium]
MTIERRPVAEDMFVNPALHALHTRQRRFARFVGNACKYETDVAPFAAVAVREAGAMRELHSLLAPGETVYMMGAEPLVVPGLAFEGTLAGVQMMYSEGADVPQTTAPADGLPAFKLLKLSCENAAEMVALTEVAFPGYFRIRTCEMGLYYGVRVEGRLVAMAGERMAFDRYKEISGVCTHPEHTGKGYAGALITRLLEDHRRDGWLSCLHTDAANRRAIALYERLGFVVSREVAFHRVVKDG